MLGLKALTECAWLTVAPFLALGLALAGIVEILDTLAGKKTFMSVLTDKLTHNGLMMFNPNDTRPLSDDARYGITPAPVLPLNNAVNNSFLGYPTGGASNINSQANKTSMVNNFYLSGDPQAIAMAVMNAIHGLLTPAELIVGTNA